MSVSYFRSDDKSKVTWVPFFRNFCNFFSNRFSLIAMPIVLNDNAIRCRFDCTRMKNSSAYLKFNFLRRTKAFGKLLGTSEVWYSFLRRMCFKISRGFTCDLYCLTFLLIFPFNLIDVFYCSFIKFEVSKF